MSRQAGLSPAPISHLRSVWRETGIACRSASYSVARVGPKSTERARTIATAVAANVSSSRRLLGWPPRRGAAGSFGSKPAEQPEDLAPAQAEQRRGLHHRPPTTLICASVSTRDRSAVLIGTTAIALLSAWPREGASEVTSYPAGH